MRKKLFKHNYIVSFLFYVGFLPVIFIIESIMDHLAMSLKMDPLAVKELNMYNKGDMSYVV